MPFGYDWTCDNCNYTIRTSGLWEFYRDRLGLRHRYGHPTPKSDEAKRAGVKGFTGVLYCTKCRQLREIVVYEFDQPQNGSMGACMSFSNPKIPHKEYKTVCDICGNHLKDRIGNICCPKCGKGKFKESGRFMS
jgi:hypothetical protein